MSQSFLVPIPHAHNSRISAGADLVSRRIHGYSLLKWTSICLFFRCSRNLLPTGKVIRRRQQRNYECRSCHLLTGIGADTFHASLWKLILMCLSPSWKVKNPFIKQDYTDMQGHVHHFEQRTNITMICRHHITALHNWNSWKLEMQPLQLHPHKHNKIFWLYPFS